MSALARYFNNREVKVFGYDRTESELTSEMKTEGIEITYIDEINSLPEEIDLVIWTPAIPKTNKIFAFFEAKKIKMMKRSEMLGQLTRDFKNIAVAGTHGKTSTSILLSHLLAHSQLKFTAFLGGISVNYHTNFLDLGNDFMVEEADEYDRSFLQLIPSIAVIGSLDADHLDIYGSREKMVENYMEFASKISDEGLLLMSNKISKTEISDFANNISASCKLLTYGSNSADVSYQIYGVENGWVRFMYRDDKNRILDELTIRFPGEHNIQNTTAAIRIALELGLEEHKIREGLLSFKGIRRRFEWLYEGKQILIDDYAHHPEELREAIKATKACYLSRRICGIFQPHLYSRTKDFAQEFAEVLDELDEVILVELYPARESPILGINSNTILDKMKNPNRMFCAQSELIAELKNRSLDVVLLLGAGDLSNMQSQIIKILS